MGLAAGTAAVITEDHRKEGVLTTGALQNAIFNSANFSSIATDAKGVIQIFNVGAERMLGYAAADVTNKITPADISDPQELIARAAALSLELDTPITPGFEALVFKASRGIEDIYELSYVRKDGQAYFQHVLNARQHLGPNQQVALLNGALVGLEAAAGMYVLATLQHSPSAAMLGAVVFLAMIGSCVISGICGAMVPLVLKRLGTDPVTASSIFLTTAAEVASMGMLLGLAMFLVK
jgi:hypothetical protein